MTAAEFARELLGFYALRGGGEAWTQYSSARDSLGSDIEPTSEEAKCWCLFGAAICLYPNHESGDLNEAGEEGWNALNAALAPYDSLVEWNDAQGRTFAEIEAALKRVAAEGL